jgi:hypothetical protein
VSQDSIFKLAFTIVLTREKEDRGETVNIEKRKINVNRDVYNTVLLI